MKSTHALLAIFVAAGLSCIAAASRAENWRPNEKMAARLQPEKIFEGFALRLPTSASSPQVQDVSGGGGKSFHWDLGESGKGGVFIVSTQAAAPNRTPEQMVTEWSAHSELSGLSDAAKSPVQTGAVGDGAFARMYYHGREKTGAKSLVHGFVYAGVVKDRAFVIEATDPTAQYTVTLPQTEAAALTLRTASADAASAAKPADSGMELSSDAHLTDLAEESPVEGYALRPPKDYQRSSIPMGPDRIPVTLWQGKDDAGVKPLFVFWTTAAKSTAGTAPLEDGIDIAVNLLRPIMPDLTMEPSQFGTVHGIPCAHTTFAGTSAGAQMGQTLSFHGVIYSLRDGDRLLLAGGMDAEPGSNDTISIIEAACRSIKKP